jgi:hypothetical protein
LQLLFLLVSLLANWLMQRGLWRRQREVSAEDRTWTSTDHLNVRGIANENSAEEELAENVRLQELQRLRERVLLMRHRAAPPPPELPPPPPPPDRSDSAPKTRLNSEPPPPFTERLAPPNSSSTRLAGNREEGESIELTDIKRPFSSTDGDDSSAEDTERSKSKKRQQRKYVV